jgi:hypothetical protein
VYVNVCIFGQTSLACNRAHGPCRRAAILVLAPLLAPIAETYG